MITRSRKRRPAVLLLEIIIAMTIMIAVMAFVGNQMVTGIRMTSFANQQTRVSSLADRVLTLLELDMESVERLFQETEADGDFGDQYPGYFWRATLEPTELDGLGQISIAILYQQDPALQDDAESASVVRELHLLKANPGRIDLEADFGFNEEQVAQFEEVLALADASPNELNMQELITALTSLPPEELLALVTQMMPLLQQMMGAAGGQAGGGGGPGDMAGLNEDQLRDMIMGRLGQLGGGDSETAAGDGGGFAGSTGMGGATGDMSADELREFIMSQVDAGGGTVTERRGRRGRGGDSTGDLEGMSRDELRDFIMDRVNEGGGDRRGGGRGNRGNGGGGRGGRGAGDMTRDELRQLIFDQINARGGRAGQTSNIGDLQRLRDQNQGRRGR